MQLIENNNMTKILFITSILFIVIISSLFVLTVEADKITSTVNNTQSLVKDVNLSPPTPSKLDDVSWWLERLIDLLGIFLGVAAIMYQMHRQHRSNLKLQRNNFKEKLRLEIYQGLIKGMDDTVNILSKASAKSSNIPISLEAYCNQLKAGIKPALPRYRALDFSETHHALIKSVAKLLHIFERYTIAIPNFRIFQIGFSSAIHDTSEAYNPFSQKLFDYLPIDIQESDPKPSSPSVIVRAIPNDEELKNISDLGQKYNNTLVVIVGFLHDLTVEAQNILLGSLFDNRVPPRHPLDPKVVVITTDKESMEKLNKYFNEETSWGKNKKQIEDYALSEITTIQKKA